MRFVLPVLSQHSVFFQYLRYQFFSPPTRLKGCIINNDSFPGEVNDSDDATLAAKKPSLPGTRAVNSHRVLKSHSAK